MVFIDWFYPGFRSGGPARSCYNLIEYFKGEYDFYVITRDSDYYENKPYDSIESNKWNKISEGLTVFYMSNDKLSFRNVKNLIAETKDVHKYLLNGIFSLHFTLFPLLAIKNKNNVLIFPRGMLANSALSVKPFKKKIFLWFAKAMGLYTGVKFIATSLSETQDIKSQLHLPDSLVSYAPNLPRSMSNIFLSKTKNAGEVALFYLGRISPEKNLHFALEVLKQSTLNITYNIYGVINNEQYWNTCEIKIKTLPPTIRVKYMGVVDSAQTDIVVKQHHFLFMPTTGENYGHSIVESLNMGCPVIISDQTPWKNLQQAGAGWDISLNEIDDFVNAIEQCVKMNQVEYDKMCESALNYSKNNIHDKKIVELNKKLFE